jgi:hypothetical protein
MSEVIVKATLPAAIDLLERWFKHELNDKTVRIETMRMLQACGKLKPLSSEAVSTLGIRDEGET